MTKQQRHALRVIRQAAAKLRQDVLAAYPPTTEWTEFQAYFHLDATHITEGQWMGRPAKVANIRRFFAPVFSRGEA